MVKMYVCVQIMLQSHAAASEDVLNVILHLFCKLNCGYVKGKSCVGLFMYLNKTPLKI